MRVTKKSAQRGASTFAAAALILGLTACATGSAPAASEEVELTDEDVTLSISWWGGDARVERTQKMLDAFEAENPNITVEAEFSDWTGYWDRLATSTAGKNSPDVIQMDELYLASYADRGALFDLATAPQLDTSALDENTLDLGRLNDGLYAYPISTTPYGILVNEKVLADLGLELPDTETWTWDDLTAFAESVTEASGGEIVGVSPLNNGFGLQLWARQAGDALFTDGEVSIKPETLEAFFQTSLDWTQDGAAAPASRLTESNAAALEQTDFGTNRQALLFAQGTQISAYSAAAGGSPMSLVKLPTEDENEDPYSYLKAGMYWSVSSQSEHPAEAALLVDYLVNNEAAGEIQGTERGIPANPDVRAAIEPTLDEYGAASFAFVDEVQPIVGAAPAVTPNGGSELDKLIARYLQDVVFETTAPAAAAESFIAELQSSIDAAS
jgi:multiple sugar transport system substrate-binding protein